MRVLNPAPLDFWQDVAETCSWATYFHTPGWALVIAKTFPQYAPATIGFIMESGSRAVIPFVVEEKKKFLKTGKRYKSMEPGVYGGLVADRELSQPEVDEILDYVLNIKNTEGRIVGNPFKQILFPPQMKTKEMYTQVLDLSPGFDELWQGFSRGQKSNIKQAQKKQVTVSRAETEQSITCYFDIYGQTLKRWGGKTIAFYPRQLFLNLFEQKDPHVHFYLAEKEGQVIAGIIVLAWQKKLLYWHGCSREEFFKDYPNNLLHYEAIKWACENNFTYYDMGASMDMEGVIKFKKSFGAEQLEFASYRWK
jgi:hypothetical protein